MAGAHRVGELPPALRPGQLAERRLRPGVFLPLLLEAGDDAIACFRGLLGRTRRRCLRLPRHTNIITATRCAVTSPTCVFIAEALLNKITSPENRAEVWLERLQSGTPISSASLHMHVGG